jgi:hypothetical protein
VFAYEIPELEESGRSSCARSKATVLIPLVVVDRVTPKFDEDIGMYRGRS